MLDILLTPDGDLNITDHGDIQLTENVRQAIRVRLLWFFGEWRFAPQVGIPYFEDVFIKNPNVTRIRAHVRREVMRVREVREVRDLQVRINAQTRVAEISFVAVTDEGVYREEMIVPWPNHTA